VGAAAADDAVLDEAGAVLVELDVVATALELALVLLELLELLEPHPATASATRATARNVSFLIIFLNSIGSEV
jgi:hypothetical protein